MNFTHCFQYIYFLKCYVVMYFNLMSYFMFCSDICYATSVYLADMVNHIQVLKCTLPHSSSGRDQGDAEDINSSLAHLDDFSSCLLDNLRMVEASDQYNFVAILGGLKCSFALAFSVISTLVAVVSFALSSTQ